MTDTSTTPAPDVRPRTLPSRMLGVVFSPVDTFRGVAAHPHWLGVLVVVLGIAGALWFWFAGTEVGQQALLDQQIRRTESMGGTVTDAQYEGFERMMPMMKYIIVGSQMIAAPVITFILAGILYAVFTAGLGGAGTFKQVLAIVAHSGVINLLQAIFTIPINYARQSMSSATNLGVFLPMLDEGSLPARFLGVIDLFIVWWLLALAIGMGVLYRRRTAPIFSTFLGIYVAIAAVVAIVMRIAGGGQ